MNDKPPEPAPRPGIKCPRCGGTQWRVVVTRQSAGKTLRVRTCRGCLLRVRTREVIEAVCDGQKPTSAA
jgi:hypothetical protein